MIFRHILVSDRQIRFTYDNWRSLGLPIAVPILYVCRRLLGVASYVLYHFNEFRFGKPGRPQAAQLWYAFKRMIGEDNAA